MLSKRQFLCSILVVFGGVTLCAKPIGSLVGSEGCRLAEEDSGPINLWTWPTAVESTWKQHKPSDVWMPEVGTWYPCCSANGYIAPRSQNYLSDWGDGFVTTTYNGGYSAGAFLSLAPGHYSLECYVDGFTQIRIGFYKETEGGYIYDSWTYLPGWVSAGHLEQVFTVPEGISLVLLTPTSSLSDADPRTVTDIEIYQIDL